MMPNIVGASMACTGVAQKQNEDVDSAQEKMSILAMINNMQQ